MKILKTFLVWALAVTILAFSIELMKPEEPEIVIYYKACKEVWHGGFYVYPDIFNDGKTKVECWNTFNGRQVTWFEKLIK